MRTSELIIPPWWSASLGNNYATPELLEAFGSPLALNVLEQATMALIALATLPCNRVALPGLQSLRQAGSLAVVGMGLANALTCRLYMISLHHLPLSLCHTIRACSPCCAAIVGLLNGQRFSARQLLALPLMVLGFGIAVSAQPSCSTVGVAAAVGSLFALTALQHLSKLTLDRGLHELQVQMLQCSLCCAFLAPVMTGGNACTLYRGLVGQQRVRELSFINGACDYVENVRMPSLAAACPVPTSRPWQYPQNAR